MHSSKRKGSLFEREVRAELQAGGLKAEKVPLSGAVKGGSFEGDIELLLAGVICKIECKRRRRGFATMYGYMANNYAVATRDDRTPTMITMRLRDFIELARRAA